MKALKILVISMGLLIVIGLGLVGYALTRKAPRPGAVATPGTVESSVPASVFAIQYPVPKGMRLEQVSVSGDRIILRLSGPEGDKLVLLNSHTGELAGTINLIQDSK
jgi:hypothetical protein